MLIPAISQVGDRSRNAGRWAAAARASQPSKPAPAPAAVDVRAGDEGDADDAFAWTPQRAMTLAAAQAAYESN